MNDASCVLTAQLGCVPSIDYVLTSAYMRPRLFARMFEATYSSDRVSDVALDLYISHTMMSDKILARAIRRSLMQHRLCVARHLLRAANTVVRMESLMHSLLIRNQDSVRCVLPFMTIVALCEMQISPDCARYRWSPLWWMVLDHITNSAVEYDSENDIIDEDDPESSNDAIGSATSM